MIIKKGLTVWWFCIMSYMLLATAAHAQTTDFEQMLDELLDGSVPMISVGILKKKLAEPAAPILLDAREPDEFAVSHLQGATNVGYEDFDLKTLAGIDKNAPIVIYCSVGYRSEKIGERLQKAGFSNVTNLRGGIFEWANRKFPLVNKTREKVTVVHPYDKDWGRWLIRDAAPSEATSNP